MGGHEPSFYTDYDKVKAYLTERGEKVAEGEALGKMQAKLFDLDVEEKLIQPHFIYHYPTAISPLSRRNDENPEITDRFELFMTGREMANAFSELNDPMDQRSRFEAQVREKEAGDDEAHCMDEDYLRALEYWADPPSPFSWPGATSFRAASRPSFRSSPSCPFWGWPWGSGRWWWCSASTTA